MPERLKPEHGAALRDGEWEATGAKNAPQRPSRAVANIIPFPQGERLEGIYRAARGRWR